jgi:two-component system, NarL family, sensor histidine kinase DesK
MRLFWLVYAVFVFADPAARRGTGSLVAVASIVIFLPLYFGIWRALDRDQDRAHWFNVAIAMLGLGLLPFLASANTYVIYSAAFAPFVSRPRVTVVYLFGLIVLVALEVVLFVPEPARFWVGVPTTILVMMIGGGNLFYAEYHRRNTLLWEARQEVEEMAALAERERISRDLHDLLGHTLSVIALKSELAAKLSDTDPVRAGTEIRDVERVSREALTEVRAAVEGFYGRGFSGELKSAARALRAARVRLEAENTGVLMSAQQESVLALVLREAVTNVVRHAGASVCRVSLADEDGHAVLTIQDDGVGSPAAEGRGLQGMRQRVAAIGGTLDVDRGNGFKVTVTLP